MTLAPTAPEAPTAPDVVGALRGHNQNLVHTIRHALPALLAVHDDPCKPAQRALLGDVIAELRAALDTPT